MTQKKTAPRIKIVELLAEKIKREGELLNIADIRRGTGIERRRLYDLRDNKASFIRMDEIEALCDYFPCEVGELVDYTSPLEYGQEYIRAPRLEMALV